MNQDTPLISIITITFNAQNEVGRTARSVRSQSFDNFEHLIIDGASTDNTLGVARSEGVAGMCIISEPDRGLYDAMNKGLHAARGRYVIFLNAGDTFHNEGTLALYADAAEGGADIVYGDTVLVDAWGNRLGPRHLSAPRRLDADSFKAGMLVCHQAFMVRRDLAPDYDLNYRFSADYDWCIRCLRRTVPERCVRLGVTIDYLSEGLTTRNHGASLRERFAIMGRHYGFATAVWRHLGFIPRAAARKLKGVFSS